MAGSSELAVLVGVLQRTSSPRERMGVLFRAYKQVKGLSAEERSRLALHLGVDGAVELVEELAERHDALPPKTVLDLLEALRAAPPSSLRTFFRKLRDPKERAALVSDGLERARQELLGEAEGAPPQSEEAPAEPDTPEEGPPKPVLQAEAPPKEPRAPAKLPPTPKRHDPQKPAVGSKHPPRSDGSGDGPVPLHRTPVPFPARPVAARRVPFSPPKATTLEPVPPTAAVPLATQLESATTLTGRFRLLRAGDAALRTSPLGGLQKILSSFPPGWPRRRALDSMLCTGAPAGLVDAMTLIETLDRPVDRRWCLRGLLRHRSLTEQEAEHVLGAEAWPGRPPRPRGRIERKMRVGATKASAPTGDRFESRVPFEDVRIHAAAVYCSDGRFGEAFDEFLQDHLGLPRYDRVAVPGGPTCLAEPQRSLAETEAVEAQLRFLLQAHRLRRVVLIAHAPCGFYLERLGITRDVLQRALRDDLVSAAGRVRTLGPVEVSAYTATATGARIRFDPIPV